MDAAPPPPPPPPPLFRMALALLLVLACVGADAPQEGSSMGELDGAAGFHLSDVHPFEATTAAAAVAAARQKRNILFPSGVKLCAQETPQQVVATHLSYFHLRVCQETIWEAFKIFWDRLPEQEEYQSWMNRCQDGSVSAQAIGSFFSQSEEHQALVKKRMSHPGMKSEPTSSWQHMCSTPTAETLGGAKAAEPAVNQGEEAGPEEGEGQGTVTELDNDIAMLPVTAAALKEQVVELSILLTAETFSRDLDEPASQQYQALSRHIAHKIEEALEGLPGFRAVSVLHFRPQRDPPGQGGVVVDYAVTVLVNGEGGVSSEQLDYLRLQSNRVENSYQQVQASPTVVYAISEVKTFIDQELRNQALESESGAVDGGGASVHVSEQLPEVVILEEEEVMEEDLLLEPSEGGATATTDSDVVVLEESAVISAPALTTAAPESGGMEEEELLLEDTVQPPAAVEEPLPQDTPTEPPPADLQEEITLPEPPVEVEASGSASSDQDEQVQPPLTEEEAEEGKEEGASEDANTEELPVAAVEEVELPEELEVSTVVTQTTEEGEGEEEAEQEEEGPVPDSTEAEPEEVVPLPEDTVEDPEPSDLPPVSEEPVEEPAEEPVVELAEEPAEEPAEDLAEEPEEALSQIPPEQAPGSASGDADDDDESQDFAIEEQEEEEDHVPVREEQEAAADAPLVIEEAPEATEVPSAEDIILVNVEEEPEPVQPTALSPERESPFTRVSDVDPTFDNEPDLIIPAIVEVEIQTSNGGLDEDGFDIFHYGYGLTNHTEEGSTGFPFGVSHGTDQASIAMPVNPGRALMVFFSLRVTNMIFSEDLFNKSSPEYKALEQRFLELLVPYLQSNLSNFENLEILNFRNGSIVVNSRMKFGKPVPRGVTTTVYLILEDFCNTAYQTMNLAIDKYSLDVESGDQADPCKFQACNEYAECKVNKWSGEAECVCNAGYFSVDGLPCQSICELQSDFCLNDGKCDIIPGQGAICRCRVGENWWYRGEHCEEYVSEPLVVGIAVASVAGFLLVASGVIFFLARTLRDQYDKDESEDPIRHAESLPSLERATKYNPMYESEATTGYSHYYRRYPEAAAYSSASAEASTDFSSEEIRHIYQNSELTKEEIQDRIRIIELYTKDRQFADFVRQHQAVMDTRRESSST